MPDANVRVICRFRPINEREKSEGENEDAPKLEYPDESTVIVKVPKQKPQIYQFDRVFWDTNATQKEIYDVAAKDTIEDILKGYNGTIFAYGQTGAGKSYTMFGKENGPEELKGIIPRSCKQLFDSIERDNSGTEYIMKCSFLEIYKECIRDLLDINRVNLKVRETPSRGVWVQDLTEHFVSCVDDVLYFLELGEKSRAVSSTNMNAVSSRSHSLFILTLTQKNADGSTKEGRLNLADLAGSEKVGKTGATGETLEEAKQINKSLSALGNCINALTKSKKTHVPYRDSKLTHILRESLGGNSKTTLIIACSPHSFNIDETISTLKFGQRAKAIKNVVKINQQRSVKELESIIENMTKELLVMRLYSEGLENEILKIDSNFDIQSLKKKSISMQNKTSSSERDKLTSSNPSTPLKEMKEFIQNSIGLDQNIIDLPMNEMKEKLEEIKSQYENKIQIYRDNIKQLKKEAEERKAYTDELRKEVMLNKNNLDIVKSAYETKKMRESQAIYERNVNLIEEQSLLQALIESVSFIEEKIATLVSENEEIAKEKEALIEFNKKLKDELSSLKQEIEKVEEDGKNAINELESLSKELQDLKSQLKAKKSIITTLENEVTTLREDLASENKILREKDIELTSKEKEYEMYKQFADEESKLSENISNVKKQNEEIEERINTAQDINAKLQNMIDKNKSSLEEYSKQIEDIQNEIEQQKLKDNDRRQDQEIQKQIDKLNEMIQKERTLREAEEFNLRILMKELDKVMSQKRSQAEEMDKLVSERTTQSNLVNTQIQYANERIQELTDKITEMRSKIDQCHDEIEGYRKGYHLAMNFKFDDEKTSRLQSKIAKPILSHEKRRSVRKKRSFLGELFSKKVYPSRKELEDASMKGTLWKQSSFLKIWESLWFILKDDHLYFFKSKNSENADGCYEVDQCQVRCVPTSENDQYRYRFVVTHPSRPSIHLCALTEKQMMSWVDALDSIPTHTPNVDNLDTDE